MLEDDVKAVASALLERGKLTARQHEMSVAWLDEVTTGDEFGAVSRAARKCRVSFWRMRFVVRKFRRLMQPHRREVTR